MNVAEIMAPVKVRVAPADTLRAVAVALRDARTGLAVVDGPERGVLTERDVLHVIAEGGDMDTAAAGDHMTHDPVAVSPDAALADACAIMIDRAVRHLLVAEGDDVVGVLNMRDVVGVMTGAGPGSIPPARGS